DQIADLLALMGDSVDNIPGVEKCGPKTAAKWLLAYGSLDGVIAAAPEIKGKVGDNLRAALDRLPLNRTLATIRTDVELDVAVTDLPLRETDVDTLRAFSARYGFGRALTELAGGSANGVVPAKAAIARPGSGFVAPLSTPAEPL